MPASLARAAAWYAERGLWIFPCWPRTKKPATKHGYKDAEPSAKRWRSWPNDNVALACEQSRIVVVDIDDPLADPPGELPPSWTSITARGTQHFYRVPDGLEPSSRGVPGIDFKWAGYVLLPPSIHPSGVTYRWEISARPEEIALADAPAWLVGATRPKRTYENDGSAAETFLAACFAHLGMLGPEIREGVIAVACPWRNEHTTDSGVSSTVIFAPSDRGLRIGSFHCSHGHCSDRRTDAVIDWMPREALIRAAQSGYRRELAILSEWGPR